MTRSGTPSPLVGNLLLALGSLLVSCLAILFLEGSLRLLELGPAEAPRLAFQQIALPVLEPGVRADGTETWRARSPRLPYQSLPRVADPSQLRVFVLGGSAAAGLGFSPNASFARGLERMLQRTDPSRTPAVVNLGLVGISSRQVARLADDVLDHYAPDLLVVYAGNNEFLELHAEKYAELHATVVSRATDLLLGSRLYRVTRQLLGRGPRDPSLAGELTRQDFELRDTILREIELSPDEVAAVVDGYEENLDALARSARAHATPLALMTVGSNWRWLGREDLPATWLDELLGDEAPPTAERLARADRLLAERLGTCAPSERSGWLYRRAVIAESRGEPAEARRLYRAAVDADPHLRRALGAMNERVASVAARRGAILVDTVARLAEAEEDGILGFDTYYDHVHFTPRGAERAAAALFEGLRAADLLSVPEDFDATSYLAARLDRLASLERDPLDVREWMGLGFDRGAVADRDLWKYDRMVGELDDRVDDPDPSTRLRARVYRGNAASFRNDGAPGAERDYRAALEIEDLPPIRRNLDRLRAEGRR